MLAFLLAVLIDDHASEYRIEGDAQFFLVVIQNRTAENRSENMEQIHTAFMREVNHRIKNGLQTIYSLLDMQKRRIADETVAIILQDAMNRIMSMIVTQKNALLSRDTLNVNLRELIQDICACFLDVVRHLGLDININMDCANIDETSPNRGRGVHTL